MSRIGGKKSFKATRGSVKVKSLKIKSIKDPMIASAKAVMRKMPTLKVGKRTTAVINPLRMKMS